MANEENLDYYLELNIDIKDLKVSLEELLEEIQARNSEFQKNFEEKDGYVFYEVLEKEQVLFFRLKWEHKVLMLHFLGLIIQSIHSIDDVRVFDQKNNDS